MQDADLEWAQRVINRWSIKKAVPAPKVTMIPPCEEIPLSGYQASTVIVNQKAWDKEDLLGKIMLLANPFGYHVQRISGAETDDKEAWELAHELVVVEVELQADARGVSSTRLMRLKSIADLDAAAEAAKRKRR